ncbi:MAG TPA: sigma-70 family RNA polymerase sigma factor [Candidatus Saccharimonadales bacterium]|nr:sigma-70 family RNA polymerase sigma factor [Candidatus Saccharimonadales bacterium]
MDVVAWSFQNLSPDESAFARERPGDVQVQDALQAGANLRHAQLLASGEPLSQLETGLLHGIVGGRSVDTIVADMERAGHDGASRGSIYTARVALAHVINLVLKNGRRLQGTMSLAGFTAAAQEGAARLMDGVVYADTPLSRTVNGLADSANPGRKAGRAANPLAKALAHHMLPSVLAPPFALPSEALGTVLESVRQRYAQWLDATGAERPPQIASMMDELLGRVEGARPRSLRHILAEFPGFEDGLLEEYTAHVTKFAREGEAARPPRTTRAAAAAGAAVVKPASPAKKAPAKKATPATGSTAPPGAKRLGRPPGKAAVAAAAAPAEAAVADPPPNEDGFDLAEARKLEAGLDMKGLIPKDAEAKAAVAVASLSDGSGFDFGSEDDRTQEAGDLQETQENTWEGASGRPVSSDNVKIYLRQAGRAPLLNAEQEVRLAKAIEAGLYAAFKLQEAEEAGETIDPALQRDLMRVVLDGERARALFIESNLRLVISVARRYTHQMEYLDLIQEGNTGVIRAVDKFDYARGYKFSTYATWWIRQAIGRAIADQARTVRIPVHMVEIINRMRIVTTELTHDYGREPTTPEIAVAMGTTEAKVVEMRAYIQAPVSLDASVGEDGHSAFQNFVVEEDAGNEAYGRVAFQDIKREIEKVLATLTPREAGVVRLRWGLSGDAPRTLQEVGIVYGVTRERIRQIEARTIAKLCHPSPSSGLVDYRDFFD